MIQKYDRLLYTVFASLTGITALLSASDPSELSIDPTAWTWTLLILAMLQLIVVSIRQAAEMNGKKNGGTT